MVSDVLCAQIAVRVGELFSCVPRDGHVRIRTPFLYSDGDIIDLFARGDFPSLELSDFGETMQWLAMQTASDRRSKKQRQIVQDVCLTHGVEFFDGMLLLRVSTGDDLATAIMRLGQAVLRIADLWFTFRLRAFEAATDEIEEFLIEKQVEYVRGERLVGRSGRTWTVDFHTHVPQRSSLVTVLSTGSRGAARGIVEHVVAEWVDLNVLRAGQAPLKFISLFDDTEDVWAAEDFRQLEPLSTVSHWSRPDEFYGELVA